ncbi:hypothetical protein Tco_1510243 [Tanacetum coccineum]
MLCFPMWLQPVMSLLVVRMESLKRAHFALIASATLELESKVDVMIDPNAQNDYSTCATNWLKRAQPLVEQALPVTWNCLVGTIIV